MGLREDAVVQVRDRLKPNEPVRVILETTRPSCHVDKKGHPLPSLTFLGSGEVHQRIPFHPVDLVFNEILIFRRTGSSTRRPPVFLKDQAKGS